MPGLTRQEAVSRLIGVQSSSWHEWQRGVLATSIECMLTGRRPSERSSASSFEVASDPVVHDQPSPPCEVVSGESTEGGL